MERTPAVPTDGKQGESLCGNAIGLPPDLKNDLVDFPANGFFEGSETRFLEKVRLLFLKERFQLAARSQQIHGQEMVSPVKAGFGLFG
jgi:hypothetical protein